MATDTQRPDAGRTPPRRRRPRRMGVAARAVQNGVRRLFGRLPLPEEDREPLIFPHRRFPTMTIWLAGSIWHRLSCTWFCSFLS